MRATIIFYSPYSCYYQYIYQYIIPKVLFHVRLNTFISDSDSDGGNCVKYILVIKEGIFQIQNPLKKIM